MLGTLGFGEKDEIGVNNLVDPNQSSDSFDSSEEDEKIDFAERWKLKVGAPICTVLAFMVMLPTLVVMLPAFMGTLPAFMGTLPTFMGTLPVFMVMLPAFMVMLPTFMVMLPAFVVMLPAFMVMLPTHGAAVCEGDEEGGARGGAREAAATEGEGAGLLGQPLRAERGA
eukprot:1178444-Prorocentrum_minimum.AAC.2